MNMIFIKNFKESGQGFWKISDFPLFFDQILCISLILTSDLEWHCRASYWLYIKVSVRWQNHPCLGIKRVIDQQYLMRFSSCEMLGENGTLTGTTCIKHYFRFNLHPYIHWYEIRLQIVTETAALQVAPPGPSLESLQWKFYCTLKNILNKLLMLARSISAGRVSRQILSTNFS